jgi:hypothetical protein
MPGGVRRETSAGRTKPDHAGEVLRDQVTREDAPHQQADRGDRERPSVGTHPDPHLPGVAVSFEPERKEPGGREEERRGRTGQDEEREDPRDGLDGEQRIEPISGSVDAEAVLKDVRSDEDGRGCEQHGGEGETSRSGMRENGAHPVSVAADGTERKTLGQKITSSP